MSRVTLIKNAFANVCRGGATAIVALIMPPFLTRILSKDAYGTWLLILQLSTYVSFLDFGIQTAVGRYIAHHNELGEFKERDSIVSTALALLSISGLIAIAGVSILAWQLPHVFDNMPIELQQDAQLALFLVGISLAIALPFSVFGGIFIGLQRYDIPAWIIGISKLFGGVFVILIAYTSHNIAIMAWVMAITNIGSGLWQFLAYKRVASNIQFSVQAISKTTGIEITSYCLSFTVWTLGMIFVSGIDTVIIGYFDYQSVVYYALAASLTGFVTSMHSAVFGAIMPKAAAIGATHDSEALGNLLISTTRYGAIMLVVTSLPLIVGANFFLTLWVGTEYASKTTLLLQSLAVANVIRYFGAPYATIALAVGEQKKIILSPVVEGFVNMIISIILTAYYGVIGVAIGTLCGAFVSLGMHYYYNLDRTSSIKVSDRKRLVRALTKPILSALPAISSLAIHKYIYLSSFMEFIFLSTSMIASYILLWNHAIFTTERDGFCRIINAKLRSFLSA